MRASSSTKGIASSSLLGGFMGRTSKAAEAAIVLVFAGSFYYASSLVSRGLLFSVCSEQFWKFKGCHRLNYSVGHSVLMKQSVL